MCLVIEGSDCLGKTTLAKKIVKRVSELGYPVVYSWMTRPNEQLFDFFMDYKKIINPCAVQDRLHLGGIAYHHNKITPKQLQIINSWIKGTGGIIAILYANNEEWYEEYIRDDKRGNLLSWPILCEANKKFKELALSGSYDYNFNISPLDKNPNYIDDAFAEVIIRDWLNRRDLLGI